MAVAFTVADALIGKIGAGDIKLRTISTQAVGDPLQGFDQKSSDMRMRDLLVKLWKADASMVGSHCSLHARLLWSGADGR